MVNMKLWKLALIVLFLSLVRQVVHVWSSAETIGQVHLLRDRQMGTEFESLSKVLANKPLIAGEKVKNKLLEVIDLNILFFAGHPNERGGVMEHEWLPWWLVALFGWGMWVIITEKRYLVLRELLAIAFVFGIAWAVSFPVIDGLALIWVVLLAYIIVGIGLFDLFFRICGR